MHDPFSAQPSVPSGLSRSPAGMRQRVWCYALMGILTPAILFSFFLLFGNDSYQYWADRYHIDLTNKYLFSRLPADSLVGPLWREDTLAGNLWIVSLITSPFSIDVLAGRLLHLPPLSIELVGTITLYFLAVVSMFIYLRRALSLSLEAATAGAVIFATTAYWDYSLNTNPNIPMAVAWLPALLAMSHYLDSCAGQGGRIALPFIGLVLLSFFCALHSTVATLPITLLLVVLYAVFVLASKRSVLWVVSALAAGVLLDAPFLWLFVEAAKLSHRNVGGFYHQASFGLQQWLAQGKLMMSQIALGLNRYGLYLVVVLGIWIWFCVGSRWSRETTRLRRIVLFAAGMAVSIFLIEFFHESINDAKRNAPLLRGWNVMRFADFAFFGLATLVAWMFDRSLFLVDQEELTPGKRTALRRAIVATGVIGSLQIAYSTYRMREVPSGIYPQNLVLYGCLVLYTIVTVSLLVLLYQRAGRTSFAFNRGGTDSGGLWCVGLVVLAVSLVTSVHAYRSGLVKPQGIEVKADTAPIMTYAQRYAVPDEVLAIKRLSEREGRVVDLTRPLNDGTWLVGSEVTMLPLSGLRVLSGYSNLYPAWYGLLIHVGVNGRSGGLWNIVQVENTDRTNFKILPLLDVQHILSRQEAVLPHYKPVARFDASGKALYGVEEGSRLGPAFLSKGFRCFGSDAEALNAMHEADLAGLWAQALLSTHDDAAMSLCTGKESLHTVSQDTSLVIRLHRGQDRVGVEVENSPGGILTLSDTYYPGWTVFVNGIKKPILRTYTALRGVMIEPGHQSVEFVYDPPVFRLLLKLSSLTLVLLLVVGISVWIRERVAVGKRPQPS